jgi:crotonobetainyl-CoA:carnitine CoA-transferase CaiB-like acyl-CoA transferase
VNAIFEGLRVVDFTQGMSGPIATMVLADHGADVIKVEPPSGDWAREMPGHRMWNRGKRSVVLDLTTSADRTIAFRLAQTADIIVEDFAAGPTATPYFTDLLTEVSAHTIVCSLTGFGAVTGLEKLTVPSEGIVVAKAGRMLGLDRLSGTVNPAAGTRPIFVAAPIASYACAMLALEGIAACIAQRARTGRGRRIETSLLDGVNAASMRLQFNRVGSELVTRRAGADDLVHRGVMLTFLTVECADDRYIQMCARQDHHFRNWMKAVGLEELLNDARYANAPLGLKSIKDIDYLEAELRSRMKTRTQAEWMDCFINDYDIGADPFLEPRDFLSHPQMVANDRVLTITDPEVGTVAQPGKLADFSVTPATLATRAPTLGEHQSLLATVPNVEPTLLVDAGADGSLPLEGVTVIELAYYLAAPMGATLLAELGARVIKIEPPGGDPWRRVGAQFAQYVKGKESLALDLKTNDGQKVLRDLVKKADVFLHNFRPGVPERLGVDYPSLSALNPDLIYVYASLYGSKGPEAHRAGFHSTPNALTGG